MLDAAPDFKILLSTIIKNQIVILGPAITLAKVRHVRGIAVTDDGTVTSLSQKPELIINELYDQFSELSAFIAKKTLAPVMEQTQSPAPTPNHQTEDSTPKTELKP